MNDTILDGDHPDENQRLLRKQRKRREERRKRKRNKRGLKKERKKKKKKKKSKRKGGIFGMTVDFCFCEFVCVMLPIILGVVLLAASIFVIVTDKIVYNTWKKPDGDCTVVSVDPVKVAFSYKGEYYPKKDIKNQYYMELNLTEGNVVPCVIHTGSLSSSSAAYDSDPQFIDLLAFVILALVVSMYILYFPFVMISIFRCVVHHFVVRYCYKAVLVLANCAWFIMWFTFFFLFAFGVAHIVIRSQQWYKVNDVKKTTVPIPCNITEIKCDYVYAKIKVQYLIYNTTLPPKEDPSNNGSKPLPPQVYNAEITDPLPNMCYRKGNVLPCRVKNDDPKSIMLDYRVPPTSWYWWIFGVTTGISFFLSLIACYGGCFLYPWFILEGLICSAQVSSGASRRSYNSLDDDGDDYVDRRIFKL